jgi:hypothetical protein
VTLAARRTADAEDNLFRCTIVGKAYEIDPSDLTWGEVEELEIFFGCVADDVDLESARGLLFLAWAAKHRTDSSFTLDQARALRVADIEFGAVPPTVSEPAATGTPS